MSKALKCERCGKCFDPSEGTGETIHFNRYSKYTPEDCRTGKYSEYLESVDFCPTCSAQYKEFMNYGKHSMYIPGYIREKNIRQDKMIERLIREKDELKARNTDLKGEIDHYKWEGEQLGLSLKKYKEENLDLGAEIRRQMKEIEMLKNERANWRKKYEDIFQNEFAKGSESIERLKTERNEAYIRCAELEKENSELKAREEEDWDTDVEEAAENEVGQWKLHYENEKHLCEALKTDLNRLRKENEELREENEELHAENDSLSRDAVSFIKKATIEELDNITPDLAKNILSNLLKNILYGRTYKWSDL